MLATLSTIAPLFILLGVGMVAGFSRRFHRAGEGLNAFVFYFSLPAFLFTAAANAPISDGVPLPFVWIPLGVTSALFSLVFLLAGMRRRYSSGRGIGAAPGPLGVAATYGNVGYLGIPIAMSVLGPGVALGAALGQLLQNVLFMVGYPLVKSLGAGPPAEGGGRARGLRRMLWRVAKRSVLLNPVTLSAIAGVSVSMLRIELPEALSASLEMLGAAAVPTAMFAVGLTIKPAFAGIRSGGISLTAVLLASAVKLVVLPLVTLGVALGLGGGLAPQWIAVAVIMAAMPVSSTASIIVFEYDGDARLVAATTLVTSILAVLTIPVVIALLP